MNGTPLQPEDIDRKPSARATPATRRGRGTRFVAIAYLVAAAVIAALWGAITVWSATGPFGIAVAALSALAAVSLLGAATWLNTGDGRLRRIATVGCVVTVASGLVPAAVLQSLVAGRYVTAGPVELGIVVLPALWALLAAWVTFRSLRDGTAARDAPELR